MPHSKPSENSARIAKLIILQINIEGLQHKITKLLQTLHIHDVHMVLIQENILPKFEIKTLDCSPTKCDCHNCRGIMTLIRIDVQAEVKKKLPFDDVDVQYCGGHSMYGFKKNTYR